MVWFRTMLPYGGRCPRENKLKRQLVMWRYELRREDNCAQVSAPFPQRHEKVPTQSDSLILCIVFLSISYLSQFVVNFPPFLIFSSLSQFFLIIFLSPCIADNLSHQVEMATCHGQGGEQDWAHTKEGKIIHKVRVWNQRWKSSNIKRIFVQETKKCLDAGRGQSMDLLYVAPCQNIPSQVEH